MKFLLFLTILILLTACTRIELGKDKLTIKDSAKSNSTILNDIKEKIPRLESSLDTPEIIESRVVDETEAVNFGDVV